MNERETKRIKEKLEKYEKQFMGKDIDNIDEAIHEVLDGVDVLENTQDHRTSVEEPLDRAYVLLECLYEEKGGPETGFDMLNLWKIKEYASNKGNSLSRLVGRVDEMEREYFSDVQDVYEHSNRRREKGLGSTHLTVGKAREKHQRYKDEYQPRITESFKKVVDADNLDSNLVRKMQYEDELIHLLGLREQISTI